MVSLKANIASYDCSFLRNEGESLACGGVTSPVLPVKGAASSTLIFEPLLETITHKLQLLMTRSFHKKVRRSAASLRDKVETIY